MGKTFSTGLLTDGISQDSSNNIGIGVAPSGTNKFEVSGSTKLNGNTAITGSLSVTAGITGSFQGTATTASYVLNAVSSSFATTASYAVSASVATNAVTASYVLNAVSASFATTAVTSSFANAFTVAGTLTATTLVVQTITSSVDFVTGSTRFGSLLANTHAFTGSVGMTGSLSVNGVSTLTGAVALGASSGFPIVGLLNRTSDTTLYMVAAATGFTLTDSSLNTMYNATPTSHTWNISNVAKMTISGSNGNVGIGTTSPTGRLMLYQSSAGNVLQNIVSNQGGSTQVGINFSPSMTDAEVAANPAQASIYATDSNYGANIIFATKATGSVGNALTTRLTIASTGAATFSGTTGDRLTLYNSGNNSGNNGLLINSDIYPGITFNNRVGSVGTAKIVYNTYATGYGAASLGGALLLQADNAMQFSTGGDNVRMTITSSGSINFSGTDATTQYYFGYNRPTATNLLVNGGNNNKIRIQNSESDIVVLNSNGNSYFNGGNVGIGTTSPAATLEVVGPNAVGTFFNAQNSGAGGAVFSRINASSSPYNQYVFNNGNVGIGASNPLATLSTLGGAVQFMGDYVNMQTIIKSAGISGTYSGNLLITIPEMSNASTDGYGGYSCEVYVSGYNGLYCHAWFSGYINGGITASEATILRSNGGWSISQSSYGTYNQGFQFTIDYPSNLTHPTARIIFNKGGSPNATAYPANTITAVFS